MKFNDSFLEDIKNCTPDILPRILNFANKKGFVCPHCGNGSGKDGTGIGTSKNNPQVIHCFKCGNSWNIFKLAQEVLNIDFNEAVKFCADAAHISLPDSNEDYKPAHNWSFDPTDPQFAPTPAQVELTDFSTFINDAASHLNDTDYWQKRGLTIETCQHFNFGFVSNFKNYNKPALIIPTGDGIHQYVARLIGVEGKNKVVASTGSRQLFNLPALNQEIVIVVEGEIDVASLWQVGFEAVGLGGTGVKNRFISAIKNLSNKPKCILLALDNDDAGIDCAKDLKSQFDSLNIPSIICTDIYDEYKDANAFLQYNSELLKNKFNSIIESSKSYKPAQISPSESNNKNNILDSFKAENFDLAKQLASDTLNDFLQKNDISTSSVYNEDILLAAGLCHFYSNEDLNLDKLQKLLKDACKRRIKIAGSDGLEHKIKLYSNKFKDTLAQIKIKKEEEAKQAARNHLRNKFNSIKKFPLPLDQIVLPNGWEFDIDNHSIVAPDSTNDTIFNSIMLITKRFKNINSSLEKIEIATLKQHAKKWSYITTERINIADKNKIVALSNFGLDVTSLNSSKLVRYFDEFERLNYDLIPTVQMVNQSGWIDDDTFVAPTDNNDLIVDYVDQETKNVIHKRYEQAGTREPVIGLLKEVKQNDFGNTTIGTVLASPFVYFLAKKNKCRNIQLHLAGKTESGKTALTFLAFSLFGNPNDLPSLNATGCGLEAIFGGNHDLCSIADDINKAITKAQKELIKQMPYLFDKGGRTRSNTRGGLRARIDMRGGNITTGETLIATDTSSGGALTRILQLISDADKIISDALSRKIYNVTSSNYGLFLHDWIECIKKYKDRMINAFDQLLHGFNGHPGWQETFKNKSFNHLDAMAAITVANIFFDQYFLGIDEQEAIRKNQESAIRILESLPDRIQIADYVRAQYKIADYINMHDNNFIHVDENGDYLPAKSFTVTYGIKHKNYVAIYKEAFYKILDEAHVPNPHLILPQLIQCGFVQKGDGKNQLCKVSIDKDPNKPRIRMVKIFNYKLEELDKPTNNPDNNPDNNLDDFDTD